MKSLGLRLDHPVVVGEPAYKPIAMTQFHPFVVNGWFIQGRSQTQYYHSVCLFV